LRFINVTIFKEYICLGNEEDKKMKALFGITLFFTVLTLAVSTASAEVCNIKVITDACPDYYDMDSMIRSITSRWQSPAEKCWVMFYWNHIGRRQTSPMVLHGLECTDPIRQFNDYGYTMCSTIAGINCSIWDAMGYHVKLWDITLHTVPEVEYDGRWHMYDNSMSAVYSLCDGRTIAGVEDIGRDGGCDISGGRVEAGHIARYHCLNATGKNGFLTGADCARDLEQEYRCFKPSGLKYRYYYYNWDRGHCYTLNLRDNEVYTRYYKSIGTSPEYYVPNNGEDPEKPNQRYRIRGNGIRTFEPDLIEGPLLEAAHSISNCKATAAAGIVPEKAGAMGEIVFKVEGANVITHLTIRADLQRKSSGDVTNISVSTTNGLTWREVVKNEKVGDNSVNLSLGKEINGAYEVLVKVSLMSQDDPPDAYLKHIEFEAITMLNSKTQPKLLLGKNTVYVGIGDQTESIVLWPDLQGENYKPYIVDEKNITSEPKHVCYQGVMHAVRPNEDAYVVFKVEAPRDITQINYGGRFYNRAQKSHIELLHSFDDGKTWAKTYSLDKIEPPWDVIHYEKVADIPPATHSVLFKYLLNSSAVGTDSCSIYSVRMEVNHKPEITGFKPIEVTFNWSEVQKDYSLIERSHTELVEKVPHKYTINVGGEDHPVTNSLRVNLKGAVAQVKYGYSDGKNASHEKYVPRWVTYGHNLAEKKSYTVSVPSKTHWGAGDAEGKKLTDGVVGPPYAGGIGPAYGLCWDEGERPGITVDLGAIESCRAFRIHLSAGWPWWDAMKGQVKDKIEVLASVDAKEYISQGFFDLNLRWKDIPVNYMMPDDETAAGFMYELIPSSTVEARYVRYKITPARTLTVSEVQVLDSIEHRPFDLRIALPDLPAGPPPARGQACPCESRGMAGE
jgi:hypothetical protein